MTDAKGLRRLTISELNADPRDREAILNDYHALAERMKRVRPIPMALVCPQCQSRHIDAGEWASRLHHVHRCAVCWHEWDVEIYSVGVAETEAERLKAGEDNIFFCPNAHAVYLEGGRKNDDDIPCPHCDRDALQAKLKARQGVFQHYHVSQDGTDVCKSCGFDLRDEIHRRVS